MKRLLLPVLMMLSLFSYVSYGQILIDSFDSTATDSTYQTNFEGGSSMTMTQETVDKVDGSASLKLTATIASLHSWGSYAQIIKRVPDGEPHLNWAKADTLKLWVKVLKAPAHPENVVFRFHIADRPNEGDNIEEYIFEHPTTLDATSEWFQVSAPLVERVADVGNPDPTGFILFPSSWGRNASQENNKKLELDKVVGYNISFITASIAADSMEFLIDKFEATGYKSVPAIVFNGLVFPSYVSTWAWGQSAIEVVPGAGPVEGSAAVKWTQGNEWGNGWTGMGTTINPPFDLGGAWQTDSVKFKLKCEEGVGALRIQFEDGTGKKGTVFTPTADNQWHDYSFALREMVFQDNTSTWDSSHIVTVGMMAEASAVAGKVVWVTDWWTGNPVFDVIPPVAPQGVAAVGDVKANIVTWTDVPDEESEKYDVYYSTSPITDVTTANVVKLGLPGGEQTATHVLMSPETDREVTYYYAVVCRDAEGNASEVSESSSPVTNVAKGVPVIKKATINVTADGDLSEWGAAGRFNMNHQSGTGTKVDVTVITDSLDCSADAYVAIDDEFLYVAFNVIDDQLSTDVSTNTYENDSPDLFIGLYHQQGAPHATKKRGEEPDYHFRFNSNRISVDGQFDSLVVPGTDYIFIEGLTGYVVEAKIPLATLAERSSDTQFAPRIGYRIPIDFAINDADGAPREGILTYSSANQNESYRDLTRWTYTWIEDWTISVNRDKNLSVESYQLLQNYPNPFNPSTDITYVLKDAGMVSVKVYDMLGREVATLVNQFENSGVHTVRFDAANLASGMYLYRIDAGNFSSTKKMVFLK